MSYLKRILLPFALTLVSVGSAAAQSPPKAPDPITIDGQPPVSSEWKLAPGRFTAAKMPIQLVYPRPDGETASWARHKKAYPGIEYRVPIAIQGGAYPFLFELVSGPPGMTVGQKVWDADYGVLSWTPQGTGGPYNVTVSVTDQELNKVNVDFTVSATRDGFVFLDPNVASSGDGSVASPLRTFDDLHKGTASDRTFAGRILYLRGGVHNLTGWAANNGNFNIEQDNKPLVWLGYPGENVTIDASRAMVVFSVANSGHDFFAQGFKIRNSRPDLADSRFFFFGGGAGNRSTFFEVEFENLVRGTSGGNDNPGAIVMFAGSSYRDYFAVINCSIEEYNAPLVGSIYTMRYAVIEGNVLGPSSQSSVNQGLYSKESNDYWSFRRNESVYQNFGYGALEHMFAERGNMKPQRIEMAYNVVRTPSISSVALVFQWAGGTDPGNSIWVYRNTLVGRVLGLDYDATYTALLENNVIFNNDATPWNGFNSKQASGMNNVSGNGSALGNALDEYYRLKDAYRSQYLGTHGHEISH